MYPYGTPYRPPGAAGYPPAGVPGYGMPPGMAPPAGYGMPPGMAPGMAPGMGAPGVAPPPGIPGAPGVAGMPAQTNMALRPGQPGFQPPNLPNINFNAPIIRLGTTTTRSGPLSATTPGAKLTNGQAFVKETILDLQPASHDEQMRSLFVGAIPKQMDEKWLDRILRAVGRLKKWVRAYDENGKACKFGFAEYEDPESLSCAIQVLKELEIPATEEGKESMKLIVMEDEEAEEFIEKAMIDRPMPPAMVDNAKLSVQAVLAEYKDPAKRALDPVPTPTTETEAEKSSDAQPEIVTIPLSADDELSDIPADSREMVAREIAAFRERSNKRDLERLKREEEAERMERERNGSRMNRHTSPPISAPTGPSGGTNSIPVGPSRLAQTPRGSTFSRDYQKGVNFVAGGTQAAPTLNGNLRNFTKEEDDSDASDSELERRRKERKAKSLEQTLLEHERRWLNRERSRTSALERERNRDRDEEKREAQDKIAMAKRLAEFNDDIEAERKTEKYYADRSQWIRNRIAFKSREQEQDTMDRIQEQKQAESEKKAQAEMMADSFLSRQAEEIERAAAQPTLAREPQKFKLSLAGAAAAVAKKAESKRQAVEVEGLLEDEEEEEGRQKRVLVPLKYEKGSEMDERSREEAIRALAKEIPSEREGLFGWKVHWDQLDEQIIEDKLRPFIEKKIVEYLGVQEQELIDFVCEHIRKHGSAEDLVKELAMTLDEDAEVMVKKVWRMVVFYSESEKRGLN